MSFDITRNRALADSKAMRAQAEATKRKSVEKALRDGLTVTETKKLTGASREFVLAVAKQLDIAPARFTGGAWGWSP